MFVLIQFLPACRRTVLQPEPERTKEEMIELGRRYGSAEALYKALQEQAKGGQRLEPASIPVTSPLRGRANRRARPI